MALTLQDDMNDIFLDSGFEEDVVYTPTGGTARTIKAIVYRQGNKQTSPSRSTGTAINNLITRMYDIEMDISTDSIEGIASVTVNEDKMTFIKAIGDSTTNTFAVAGIVQNDEGAFRIGLKP